MRIDLEYQIDELSKKRYIFWFDHDCTTLWVDEYHLMKRETLRHKYRSVQHYERLRPRESNIRKEDVLLDDKIKQDAINSMVAQIKVDFWTRR